MKIKKVKNLNMIDLMHAEEVVFNFLYKINIFELKMKTIKYIFSFCFL